MTENMQAIRIIRRFMREHYRKPRSWWRSEEILLRSYEISACEELIHRICRSEEHFLVVLEWYIQDLHSWMRLPEVSGPHIAKIEKWRYGLREVDPSDSYSLFAVQLNTMKTIREHFAGMVLADGKFDIF